MDYSQSQSLSQRGKEPMSEEQLAAAAIKVKDYLLCDMRYMRKIKKDEIVVSVLNKSARQYGEIMKRVKQILLNVFGLRLAKLPGKDDEFIIVNNNPAKYLEATEQEQLSEKEQDEIQVLHIVLASILLNKNTMYESHLLRILDLVGFTKDSFYDSSERKSKDYIPKIISNLVKQMYLEAQKVERPTRRLNPPLPDNDKVTVYKWGYRALLEVDVDSLHDKFILQIYNGKRPDFFPPVHFGELKELQASLRAKTLE